MQSQNRFFDDMARVAAGAVGALAGVRGEVEARLAQRGRSPQNKTGTGPTSSS